MSNSFCDTTRRRRASLNEAIGDWFFAFAYFERYLKSIPADRTGGGTLREVCLEFIGSTGNLLFYLALFGCRDFHCVRDCVEDEIDLKLVNCLKKWCIMFCGFDRGICSHSHAILMARTHASVHIPLLRNRTLQLSRLQRAPHIINIPQLHLYLRLDRRSTHMRQ